MQEDDDIFLKKYDVVFFWSKRKGANFYNIYDQNKKRHKQVQHTSSYEETLSRNHHPSQRPRIEDSNTY